MHQQQSAVEVVELADLATLFWQLHVDGLADQKTLCAALGKSKAWAERARWSGTGPRFKKIGRHVRYRKGDVIAWLNAQPTVHSTSQLEEA